MASGSLPRVLHPVNEIAGAGKGPFYDGGITDYHFDIPFSDEERERAWGEAIARSEELVNDFRRFVEGDLSLLESPA